jgi:uncharacterized membrane protein
MIPRHLPAVLMLAAGCASTPTVYQPVADPTYMAIGRDPFWMIAIGDSRIVLRTGVNPGSQSGAGGSDEVADVSWPRVLPRNVDGVRTWQSGEGTSVITIEARPGPCEAGRQRFADHVRARLNGRELNGCGGRPLNEDQG